MKPIVAGIGRPNVGKSTLFNKLLGKKKAIVHDQPGVTRDLNYADTEEMGMPFTLVDTGGFEPDAGNIITKQVRDQARLAIEDADVIVFVMDARAGLIPQDEELVDMLRRAGKPVIYVANKIDTPRQAALVADFYSLGVDEIMGVSAEHGLGITELIDEILRRLPEREEVPVDEDRIKVAIVGRPNVGKSSLLNRLIGKSRAIVSDIAGATRDSVDTPVDMDGGKYLFIDTAGIRKKSKVSLTVEAYSVMEAIRSIERCDVALLLVDGKEGVSTQDEKIAGPNDDRKKCCAVVVNKWDLAPEKDTHTVEYAKETIRQKLPFIAYAPVVVCPAHHQQGERTVLQAVNELFERG